MILGAFRRGDHSRNIPALYGAIVAQARSPVFYTHYGVSDSVEGRFELIVLHLMLVLRRLGAGRVVASERGPSLGPGSAVGQRLFDVFCRDLDDNLREMGVGDLPVPRRMRQSVRRFTAARRPMGRRSPRLIRGSLRRRWHAIS
jgi:cytochrome b pre-mRNA-processing protein 3